MRLLFSACALIMAGSFLFSFQTDAATGPSISSLSVKRISVLKKAGQDVTFTVYGENLDPSHNVLLGKNKAKEVGAGGTSLNVTFRFSKWHPKPWLKSFPVTIYDTNGNLVATSQDKIEIFNPYRSKYKKNKPQRFLKRTPNPHKVNKRTIGVDAHWTLGGDTSKDSNYRKKLKLSNTKWAREQITYSSWTGSYKQALKSRYDKTMMKYKKLKIRPIGLISYDQGTSLADEDAYRKFVKQIVKRYRNFVNVWEVQNPTHPTTYGSYAPMIRIASEEIRLHDPDAIILMGAYGFANNDPYLDDLYGNAKQYFDAANLRVDYCGDYKNVRNMDRLKYDMYYFYRQVSAHRADEPVWATEIGCAKDVGGETNFIKDYVKNASKTLLDYSYMKPVMLQTSTNNTSFNISYDDGPAWKWYKRRPKK